jgi:hypothetical protein
MEKFEKLRNQNLNLLKNLTQMREEIYKNEENSSVNAQTWFDLMTAFVVSGKVMNCVIYFCSYITNIFTSLEKEMSKVAEERATNQMNGSLRSLLLYCINCFAITPLLCIGYILYTRLMWTSNEIYSKRVVQELFTHEQTYKQNLGIGC